jgi:hypothetical protein
LKKLFIFLITGLFLIQCTQDDPTGPGTAPERDIIILEDSGTQDSIVTILNNAGFKADLGGPYWMYTGENLRNYRVVLFLNGVEWIVVMPDSVQQKIRAFVQNGGSLITTEWISWSGATNQIINDILPVVYGGSWSVGSEMYYKSVTHPVSIGLPDSFQVSGAWSFSVTHLNRTELNQAEVIFTGSRSGAAVVTGAYGSGTVIHWNMGGHYNGSNIWSFDVKTLLINMARFAVDSAY